MLASRVEFLVAVWLVLGSGALLAQPSTQLDKFGQWAGPYDLSNDANFNSNYAEITHAALMPLNEGKVILWCRDKCGASSVGYTETYVWEASQPGAVDVVIVPGANATNHLFCSGHTWTREGKLVVVGGNDYLVGCSTGCGGNSNVGHAYAFELDPFAPGGPTWSATATNMHVPRWYPSVIPLGGPFLGVNDCLYVSGHLECPILSPPQEERFEIYNVASRSFTSIADNATFDTLANPASCDPLRLDTGEYPRLHQLKSNYVMWCDAFGGTGFPCGGTAGLAPIMAFFDYTQPLGCTAPAERIRVGCNVGAGFNRRHDANSVQIVYPDEINPALWHEVIYLIGGSIKNVGPVSEVNKIIDPVPGSTWSTPPSIAMNEPKYKANSVLGLDGSIVVFGGRKQVVQGISTVDLPVLKPERCEPPELFVGSTGAWEQLAEQSVAREYHSIALLLPDGRMVSGGGEDIYNGTYGDPNHTMEIYSPGYMFKGRRPTLASYPSLWGYGALHSVTITLAAGKSLRHFALVRPGSVTHAFDASQRYVKLRHASAGSPVTFDVTTPPDAFHAPRGRYLLTAVDSAGVASVAKVIDLQ
jgi:Domain of unknown function (DUF1929)